MRSLLLAAALLALPAVAQSADAGAGASHPLAGTWKLDLQASSDPKPMLEHFSANFLVRGFSKSVETINVITWTGEGFALRVKAPLHDKRTQIHFDGKTPTKDEFFGNPYTYTSRLEGDAVVSTGTVLVNGGAEEGLAMRRLVEPDGRMVLYMTITPKEGKPLEVKRVFKRQAP